jgi:hypothetical protein
MIIAAAAYNPSKWYQNLSFNWFDVFLIAVLAFGVWRGRKNGMSREVLPVSMWLLIIILGGLCAPLLADFLVKTGYVGKVFGTMFVATTAASIFSYLFIALVVFLAFTPLRKKFREKVSGSNTFGSGEYYLGMIAGLVRFSCILLFFLALLNTPVYSTEEIAAQKAYNARWFGGGQAGFSGNFFPTLSEIQADVFVGSLSGRIIRDDLSIVLLRSSVLSKKSHT